MFSDNDWVLFLYSMILDQELLLTVKVLSIPSPRHDIAEFCPACRLPGLMSQSLVHLKLSHQVNDTYLQKFV